MILLEMGAAANGVDPRVTIDGVDVTERVSSVELLPLGVAVVRLYLSQHGQLPKQIVQQKYKVV